ncbi:hypothetical protein HXX76_009079 [Chlamydomonas incerta]|uniref:Peptidase S8/S53 domain-containing protein n=1 Tax=Chlamydomonas incerta TaxID=51695 RepID=A0A835SRT9_CHLIN|nr:hypothetical protein HXX76_009079 [Chlamydomonas incerta]|eukprot:KAG2432157.1 hypothetical protein HXX76_009079 [Chlamydomonas incerta]
MGALRRALLIELVLILLSVAAHGEDAAGPVELSVRLLTGEVVLRPMSWAARRPPESDGGGAGSGATAPAGAPLPAAATSGPHMATTRGPAAAAAAAVAAAAAAAVAAAEAGTSSTATGDGTVGADGGDAATQEQLQPSMHLLAYGSGSDAAAGALRAAVRAAGGRVVSYVWPGVWLALLPAAGAERGAAELAAAAAAAAAADGAGGGGSGGDTLLMAALGPQHAVSPDLEPLLAALSAAGGGSSSSSSSEGDSTHSSSSSSDGFESAGASRRRRQLMMRDLAAGDGQAHRSSGGSSTSHHQLLAARQLLQHMRATWWQHPHPHTHTRQQRRQHPQQQRSPEDGAARGRQRSVTEAAAAGLEAGSQPDMDPESDPHPESEQGLEPQTDRYGLQVQLTLLAAAATAASGASAGSSSSSLGALGVSPTAERALQAAEEQWPVALAEQALGGGGLAGRQPQRMSAGCWPPVAEAPLLRAWRSGRLPPHPLPGEGGGGSPGGGGPSWAPARGAPLLVNVYVCGEDLPAAVAWLTVQQLRLDPLNSNLDPDQDLTEPLLGSSSGAAGGGGGTSGGAGGGASSSSSAGVGTSVAVVSWVGPLVVPQLHNAPTSLILQTGDITADQFASAGSEAARRPLWEVGLDGAGEIIGIADSGIDLGSCHLTDPRMYVGPSPFSPPPPGPPTAPNDATGGGGPPPRPPPPPPNFQTFVNPLNFSLPNHRKLVRYWAVDVTVPFKDPTGHGTFVCGSAVGAAVAARAVLVNSVTGAKRSYTLDTRTGSAPGARLSVVAFADKDGALLLPQPVDQLLLPVHDRAGAAVSSDSWGFLGPSLYGAANGYDRYLWLNDHMVAFISAGNSGLAPGIPSGTITSPSTAKNVIAVGGTLKAPAGVFAYSRFWVRAATSTTAAATSGASGAAGTVAADAAVWRAAVWPMESTGAPKLMDMLGRAATVGFVAFAAAAADLAAVPAPPAGCTTMPAGASSRIAAAAAATAAATAATAAGSGAANARAVLLYLPDISSDALAPAVAAATAAAAPNATAVAKADAAAAVAAAAVAVAQAADASRCTVTQVALAAQEAGASALLMPYPSATAYPSALDVDPAAGVNISVSFISPALAVWLYGNATTAAAGSTTFSTSWETASLRDIVAFSSYGPAPDGRVKPDLVAPAFDVLSVTRSPGNTFPRPATCHNTTNSASGNSMSSPHAAGSAAITRQYFRSGYYPAGSPADPQASPFSPSGMLIKAVLIAGAEDLQGGSAMSTGAPLGPTPDPHQGWGRINLARALPLLPAPSSSPAAISFPPPSFFFSSAAGGAAAGAGQQQQPPPAPRLQVADRGQLWGSGDSVTLHGLTATGAGPITVVLVWYDFPTAGPDLPSLVNDLDLRVDLQLPPAAASAAAVGAAAAVRTYLGNNPVPLAAAAASEQPPPPPQPDRVNTVERVALASPPAGAALTITVTAARLASPFLDDPDAEGRPQRFAVAVSGHFTGVIESRLNPAYRLAPPDTPRPPAPPTRPPRPRPPSASPPAPPPPPPSQPPPSPQPVPAAPPSPPPPPPVQLPPPPPPPPPPGPPPPSPPTPPRPPSTLSPRVARSPKVPSKKGLQRQPRPPPLPVPPPARLIDGGGGNGGARAKRPPRPPPRPPRS